MLEEPDALAWKPRTLPREPGKDRHSVSRDSVRGRPVTPSFICCAPSTCVSPTLREMNDDEVGLADLPGDLPALMEAFALATISVIQHLSNGWMNRNWKLTAGPEKYVLKRLLDISAASARAVFAAVGALASRSVPVCLPVRSVSGETVVDFADRAYCLMPWVDGVHRDGCDLPILSVADLGRLVARIHQALEELPDDC